MSVFYSDFFFAVVFKNVVVGKVNYFVTRDGMKLKSTAKAESGAYTMR